MRQITASISKGKLAPAHNRRDCYAESCPDHIDPKRTPENVTLVDRDIAEVYEERFGQALEDYNRSQVEKGHGERQIDDYLAKVRDDKKLNEAYEFVVQIGNKDDQLEPAEATKLYREWLTEFQARYSQNFAVVQAIVHNDEATPHMHLEVVPAAYSKRGLSVQNSLNKALAQSGAKDYKGWLAELDGIMGKVMKRHLLERVAGDRDKQLGGVDIDTYRQTMHWREGVRAEAEREAEEKVHAAEVQAQSIKAAVEKDLLETRGELTAVNDELKEKQASSAALDSEIAEKKAEKAGIAAEIADFSAKKESMKAEEGDLNKRLEYLRQLEERDSSIESEYRQLKNEKQALEQESRRLAADDPAARRDKRFRAECNRLGEREYDLVERNESLRGLVEELIDKVIAVFGVIRGLPTEIADFLRDEFWRKDLPIEEAVEEPAGEFGYDLGSVMSNYRDYERSRRFANDHERYAPGQQHEVGNRKNPHGWEVPDGR